MTDTAKKWTEDRVNLLLSTVGSASPVSSDLVAKAAEVLETSVRSVASKLRQLKLEVASLAKERVAAFNQEQTAALTDFVKANANTFTYKEIAERFEAGAFTAKQVQGKLLALELTALVKPTEKVEAARMYSDAETDKFVALVNAGKFIEEIAAAMGKSIPSVRGKALSLSRSGEISKIPAQKESHAKPDTDPVEVLGDKLATMTVADIAAATDKTERGIKTLLTRRGIKVADYDGVAKKAKAEAKAATA